MNENKALLAQKIKQKAYLTGDFTTKAGKKTSYYRSYKRY